MAKRNKAEKRPTVRYLPADPDAEDDDIGDGFCQCPACGATYETAYIAPCNHLITDWCYTAEVERGEPRGYWAGTGNGRILSQHNSAMRTIRDLLAVAEGRGTEVLDCALTLVPPHLLRPSGTGRARLAVQGDLIAEAPGYLGSHCVQTGGMASDEWDVHWAEDGAKAADHIEAALRGDLETIAKAATELGTMLGVQTFAVTDDDDDEDEEDEEEQEEEDDEDEDEDEDGGDGDEDDAEDAEDEASEATAELDRTPADARRGGEGRIEAGGQVFAREVDLLEADGAAVRCRKAACPSR